jgi:two-component system OmpR family response regulator
MVLCICAYNVDDGRMPKVLVVEDEPSIVTIVRYHLESAGFEGVFAGDVTEGWRLALNDQPDAAVIDIKLPGPDGWSLIERMRDDERLSPLPIVVLTGLMEPDVMERAESLGCEYLSKPFAASALLDKLRHLLVLEGPATPGQSRVPRSDAKEPLVAVAVVLLLDGYHVDGTVYLPPELARFSDAWETLMRDQRAFFPVTNATVYPSGGGHPIAQPAFVEIRKQNVRAVFPKDVQPQ